MFDNVLVFTISLLLSRTPDHQPKISLLYLGGDSSSAEKRGLKRNYILKKECII